MLKFLCVIPARFNASRFPGKPLVSIKGKSMIQRVYEQVLKADFLDKVVIATDDKRIQDHAREFGATVLMTSKKHSSGTERCYEAMKLIHAQETPYDIIINVQGDEPFIKPSQIELLSTVFESENVDIATLAKRIDTLEELRNPNTVKVVVSTKSKALYFSRQPIPYFTEKSAADDNFLKENIFYKHIGIYAYRSSVLEEIYRLPQSPLEVAEKLEQLRWLEHNYSIFVNFTQEESLSIDTPEDLACIIHKK